MKILWYLVFFLGNANATIPEPYVTEEACHTAAHSVSDVYDKSEYSDLLTSGGLHMCVPVKIYEDTNEGE